MTDEPVASEQQAETIDPLTLFSENIRLEVEGLMYLGQLTDTVHFCGHTFDIKTLLPEEKLAISVVLQPYRNTINEVDAYQMLTVGMATTAVDGDQAYAPPIGPDLEDLARARLKYIAARWYPPTIEYLWNRCVFLEATATQAIAELDRLSQRSQPSNLPPWLDSSTGQGPSDEEQPSDTPLFTPFRPDFSS